MTAQSALKYEQALVLLAMRTWGGMVHDREMAGRAEQMGMHVSELRDALNSLAGHGMVKPVLKEGPYTRRFVAYFQLRSDGAVRIQQMVDVGYSLGGDDAPLRLLQPDVLPVHLYLRIVEGATNKGPESGKKHSYKEIPDHIATNERGKPKSVAISDEKLKSFSRQRQAAILSECPRLKEAHAVPALRLLEGLKSKGHAGWIYTPNREAYAAIGELIGTTSPQVIDAITMALSREGKIVRQIVDTTGRGSRVLRGVALPQHEDELRDARAKELKRPKSLVARGPKEDQLDEEGDHLSPPVESDVAA